MDKNGIVLGLIAASLLAAGCRQDQSLEDSQRAGPPPGMTFSLLIAGDPQLAEAVRQFETEWHEQTGLGYQVAEMEEEEFASAERLDADLVICPSYLLGPLAERGRIEPLPREMLRSDAGNLSDVFDLLRVHEVAWGGEVFAAPFGSPVLICYYRKDVFQKLGMEPPRTWQQYGKLAAELASHPELAGRASGGQWYGTVEPLGPGWAGITLVARAAAYVTHREIVSTFFDVDSMEPLIATPPWVRALEELAAAAAHGPAEQIEYDPAQARAAFWQGRTAMALSWPSPTAQIKPTDEAIQVGVVHLPGAAEVYNVLDKVWEKRRKDEQPWVPVLGISGRIGVVTTNCQWPKAGFQLLFWLSGPELGRQICTRSPHTTLFRHAHVASPSDSVEQPMEAAEAADYAALVEEMLSGQQRLFALRIPGRAEYLRALDDAVRRVLAGQATAQEALTAAAKRWNEITDRLGRQAQRACYLHSLGQP